MYVFTLLFLPSSLVSFVLIHSCCYHEQVVQEKLGHYIHYRFWILFAFALNKIILVGWRFASQKLLFIIIQQAWAVVKPFDFFFFVPAVLLFLFSLLIFFLCVFVLLHSHMSFTFYIAIQKGTCSLHSAKTAISSGSWVLFH